MARNTDKSDNDKPERAARTGRVRPGPSSRERKAGSYTKAVQSSRGRKFVQEVVAEMKKVTWPNRQELLQATLVVIVAVAIMATFLGFADVLSERLTDWIFQ